MGSKRFHERLKNFLIKLGEKEGYESYSGDSECLDIRMKRKRIEYKPDVIWKSKTSCYVFEIAFTEDWRAIVGEFTLAWLAGCSRFIVFRLTEKLIEANPDFPKSEARFLSNLLSFLGKKFKMKWHLWVFAKELEKVKELGKGFQFTEIEVSLLFKDWGLIKET